MCSQGNDVVGNNTTDQKRKPSLSGIKVEGLLQLSLVVMVFLALSHLAANLVGLANIRNWVDQAGIYGPLVFIALKALTIVIAPLGGTIFYLAAGHLFGFADGVLYVFIADLVGHLAAFWLARVLGRSFVRRLVFKSGMRTVGSILFHLGTWRGLLYARLIFLGLQDFVSYAAGLTTIQTWQYTFITMLTLILPTVLVVATGLVLIEDSITTITSILLACLGIIAIIVQWLRSRENKSLHSFISGSPTKSVLKRRCYKILQIEGGGLHRLFYHITGGVIGGSIRNGQILLLTTVGNKTGKLRTSPLIFFRDDDVIIVIASNGGLDYNPAWYINLMKNPEATIQIGRQKLSVRAREAMGKERSRLWGLVIIKAPLYERYQQSTRRRIPLVVLCPSERRNRRLGLWQES